MSATEKYQDLLWLMSNVAVPFGICLVIGLCVRSLVRSVLRVLLTAAAVVTALYTLGVISSASLAPLAATKYALPSLGTLAEGARKIASQFPSAIMGLCFGVVLKEWWRHRAPAHGHAS